MSDDRAYDEPLPWLAAVDDEDEPRGVSARRMLAALVVVSIAALMIAGTFFWLGRRDTAVNGPPELIAAPAEPYKVKPPNPGGLDIKGESETAFETSAGEDRDAQLDLNKLPEAPIAKPAPPQPKPETKPAEASKVEESAASASSGSVVQLGAFANQDDRPVHWRHSPARCCRFARRGAANLPDAEGSGRELLRRAIGSER